MQFFEAPPVGLQLPAAGTPLPESASAMKGMSQYATPFDHQHPRITQGVIGTLGSTGEATVMFPKPFTSRPLPFFSWTESADLGIVVFKTKTWLGVDGLPFVSGSIGGAIVKGYRTRKLPTQTPVTGILTAVVTGVNNALAALAEYDIAAPAMGVEFSMLCVPPTSATP